MKLTAFIATLLLSASALAATFDINDPQILGQYELVNADPNAEIQEVKIIYDHDGQLVLVRDDYDGWPLTAADTHGVIFTGEDEPNPGSGDEPNCYYDASITVRLTETRDARGILIPQIIIDVDRVDAYEAEPDYSYQVVFNWKNPIEDAVPFYFNMEAPADLQSLKDFCKNEYITVLKDQWDINEGCHGVESYRIRDGVPHAKAFAALKDEWKKALPLSPAQLRNQIFPESDLLIAKIAAKRKQPQMTERLIAATQPLRDYMMTNSTELAVSPDKYSFYWVYVLDSKNGVMHRFSIHTD